MVVGFGLTTQCSDIRPAVLIAKPLGSDGRHRWLCRKKAEKPKAVFWCFSSRWSNPNPSSAKKTNPRQSVLSVFDENQSNPNKPLQLTAGNCGFYNVFGVATGFGLSDVFRKAPAATELWSLGGKDPNVSQGVSTL